MRVVLIKRKGEKEKEKVEQNQIWADSKMERAMAGQPEQLMKVLKC
jgi:hypothetical protein